MKLRHIITRAPAVISPEATVSAAARKMSLLDVGMLPVCECRLLVGAITDRDITVRAIARGRDPRKTKVREIMTARVICCFEDQDLLEAAQLMEEQQIRRLPVLDDQRRLVGILSLTDLVVRAGKERLAGCVLGRISDPFAAATAESSAVGTLD